MVVLIWGLLGLLIAGFTALPLFMGFWPIGIVAAVVATILAGIYVYVADSSGEEGLGVVLMAAFITVCIWFGIALAGIITGIQHWIGA
jgi:hypothetical protein